MKNSFIFIIERAGVFISSFTWTRSKDEGKQYAKLLHPGCQIKIIEV